MKLTLANGLHRTVKFNMSIPDEVLRNQIKGHTVSQVSLTAREVVDLDNRPQVKRMLVDACMSVAVSEHNV